MRRNASISRDQNALPFRRKGRKGVLAYALPWERRLLGFLLLAFFLTVALYVYFVIASIFHVADRQELMSRITATKAAVSVLETAYLAKTEGITESYAIGEGYVENPKQIFVERDTAVSIRNVR